MNPLSTLHAARAFVGLVRDPNQLDAVFALADRFAAEPQDLSRFPPEMIARIEQMDQVPLLPPLEELRALPDGTLGRAYAAFMDANGLTAGALAYDRDDSMLHRFRKHTRSTHDLWHVVTGFGPDGVGELGLQGFYQAQLGGAFPLTLITAGLLHLLWKHQELASPVLDAVTDGWRAGQGADNLLGMDWTPHLGRPLAEVRAELHIEPARADYGGLLPLAA